MTFIHYDEAKRAASGAVRDWVRNDPKIERALLVRRLGRLGDTRLDEICRAMAAAIDC